MWAGKAFEQWAGFVERWTIQNDVPFSMGTVFCEIHFELFAVLGLLYDKWLDNSVFDIMVLSRQKQDTCKL